MVQRRLDQLDAVPLLDALKERGIDTRGAQYAAVYNWATSGRGGELRPFIFIGPRNARCVRRCDLPELDAALEASRCKETNEDGERCARLGLLSKDGLCRHHSVGGKMRGRYEKEAAPLGEQGWLFGPEVARMLRVSGPHLTRRLIGGGLLKAERRKVGGRWCHLLRKSDVRDFQRKRPKTQWLDPVWVREHVLDSGMVKRRAEKEGIPESKALELFLGDVEVRRRRPPGRPGGRATPAHHLEWCELYRDLREHHERMVACGDEEVMPSHREICLEVAREDYVNHPERWRDYTPDRESRA